MRAPQISRWIDVESLNLHRGRYTALCLHDSEEFRALGEHNAQIEVRVTPDGAFEVFYDPADGIVFKPFSQWYDADQTPAES